MKRRSILIALTMSPAMLFADSFSSRSAGDKRRMRELNQKFREEKKFMQEQQGKEKKENDGDKTGEGDRSKSGK